MTMAVLAVVVVGIAALIAELMRRAMLGRRMESELRSLRVRVHPLAAPRSVGTPSAIGRVS